MNASYMNVKEESVKLLDIVDGTSIRYAYRMAFLTNFYREPLLRQIEREFGIIRPEWTILICLYYGDGLNPRDICEITEQPRNTISRAARSAIEKGLITQVDDVADARRTLLYLTDKGRDLYETIIPIFEETEEKMLACLDSRERKTLDRLLNKLCRAVPEWAS